MQPGAGERSPRKTRESHPVREWLDAVAAFFFPEICQICFNRRARADEGYICLECRTAPGSIRFIEAPFCQFCGLPFPGEISHEFFCTNCASLDLQFDSARSAVVMAGLPMEAIHRYKYNRALWFEPFLGNLLVSQMERRVEFIEFDFVVPVPLHRHKIREREFNQAERLAAHLARVSGIPVRTDLVRRVRDTQTQTRLSRDRRAENMRNAFAWVGKAPIHGASVLLLDDVLTTGSTTSDCARALKKGGATTVHVWTLARGV